MVQKQPVIQPSAYQESLDAGTTPAKLSQSSVRYWSDFSRVFYHPRSLVQLYDYELDSTIRPFERHAMGEELFDTLNRDEDVADRDLRPFIEECDQMQGIQTLATLDDAWGGFAARYLDVMRDEYPKTSLWLWGLESPLSNAIAREKRQLRIVNSAQAVAHACSVADVVVPLALPTRLPSSMAGINPASPWHLSAAYATAIETITLPSRLASPQSVSLADLAQSLNTGGNQTLARLRMKVGDTQDAKDDGSVSSRADADFFGLGLLRNSRDQSRKTGKIFGQVASSHGSDVESEGDAATDKSQADPRARRRVGEPVYERSVNGAGDHTPSLNNELY